MPALKRKTWNSASQLGKRWPNTTVASVEQTSNGSCSNLLQADINNCPSFSILLLLTRLNEDVWKYFDFPCGPIRKLETMSLKASKTTVLHCDKGVNPSFCWHAYKGKKSTKRLKYWLLRNLILITNSPLILSNVLQQQQFVFLWNIQVSLGFVFF